MFDPSLPESQWDGGFSAFPLSICAGGDEFVSHGLSKRELFAAIAFHAMLSSAVSPYQFADFGLAAKTSVEAADKLLDALKTREES